MEQNIVLFFNLVDLILQIVEKNHQYKPCARVLCSGRESSPSVGLDDNRCGYCDQPPCPPTHPSNSHLLRLIDLPELQNIGKDGKQ